MSADIHAPAASSRRPRAPWAACLALLAGACGGDPLAPRPDAHLIVISIDTLRADHVGAYGYPRDTTPVLDALAEESVLFEDVLATASNTAPSHMTMFTGVLPRVHGITNDALAVQDPKVRLLAERLSDEGWRTAAFADGGLVRETNGFDRGFDHFVSRYEFLDDKLDDVEAWLAAAPDEPTFLFLHTYDVHAPYLPTAEHDLFTDPDYAGRLAGLEYVLELRVAEGDAPDMAQLMKVFWEQKTDFDEADVQHLIDLYDGALHRVDAGLGRLFDLLEAKGWLDDAWVVVTSDHGEAFGEHGTYQHRQVHQEELAVPLIVRPPGGLPGGRRVAWPVSHLDLSPTLLAALGLEPEPGVQGRALWPLDAPVERPRFASGGDGMRFDVVVDDARKLVRTLGGDKEGPRVKQLFDLAADPDERRDLAEAEPAPSWRDALLRRLVSELEASRALRERLGEPELSEALSEEQRAELEALGYLR